MEALYHAVLDLASVGERFRNQLLNLPLDQHPDRIAKAAEYYTGQLKAFASALAAVSDIEIDNKETRRQFAEALADLTDRLGQKQACIAAVADKGFSVAAVQKAKADYVLQKDKGGDTAKSARGAKRRKAAQSPDRAATPLSGRPAANEVQLTEHLRLWRKSKAEELGIPPFMILSQKALMGIVAATPRTAAQLLAVDGVGRITVQRYGNDILEIVQSLA
jgi:superfamily II DNA helicase RecQ